MDPSADFAEYYLGAVENINNSKTVFKSTDDKEVLSDDDKMMLLEMMSGGNSNSVMH